MNKKRWILIIVLVALVAALTGYKVMTTIPKVQTFAMEEQDRLPVGRASIGLFNDYNVVGSLAYYDELKLEGNDAVSRSSFLAWVDQRWQKIREDDAKQDVQHPPRIYRPSPHEVGFKYGYQEIKTERYESSSYKGEGAVWMGNKALFIASGGGYNAYEKVINIINHISEIKSKDDKGFCLEFYCLNLPASENESAGVTINFHDIKNLMLSVTIETYTSSQNDYYSQRAASGGIILSSVMDMAKFMANYYSNAEKRQVDGLIGEQDIMGMTDHIGNKYDTLIHARWYHPGTSGDTSDPSIEINLVYEYQLDHKPSRSDWFDDETANKTGLTPEKFLSIWEATLKGFKRNR